MSWDFGEFTKQVDGIILADARHHREIYSRDAPKYVFLAREGDGLIYNQIDENEYVCFIMGKPGMVHSIRFHTASGENSDGHRHDMASIFHYEGTGCKNFTSEFSEFMKGVIEVRGPLSDRKMAVVHTVFEREHFTGIWDDGEDNMRISFSYTLPEIIERFDPDTEGIEPSEPDESTEKSMLESAKKRVLENYTFAPAPGTHIDDPAENAKLLDGCVTLYAMSKTSIPAAVRGLKLLKSYFDRNGIEYRRLVDLDESLYRAERTFDRFKIDSSVIPFGKDR